MTHHPVLYLLYSFGFLLKGQTAPVQTQLTVMAAVGDETCLSCQLIQPKEVLQVTWQKLSPGGVKNVATSTKYFGLKVNPDFIDKVEFRDAGLQNNSIVIRNVTEQDESCYHCLFNIDHEGAVTGKTCLRLYELHEPVLHVESNSAEEAVVSCSATGRPAPTVTLRVLQQDLHLSNYTSVSVTYTNSTVTVTSTAVLFGFRDDCTQVGCAVRVLSGPQKEVFMMIPEVKQSADGFDEKSGSNNRDRSLALIIVSLLVVVLCGIAAALVRHKLKNQNRNDEKNKMIQVTIKDTKETFSLLHKNSEENQTDKTTERTEEVQTPTEDQEEIRQLTPEENQTDKITEDTHEIDEMNEMVQVTIKDTKETEASSDTQVNGQIRKRTSSGKSQASDDSNPSPSPRDHLKT